eukprot:2003001-Prymnesium_polylepis.1
MDANGVARFERRYPPILAPQVVWLAGGRRSEMYVAKPTWCSPAPPSHAPTPLATVMMRLTSHAPTSPPCSAAIDSRLTGRPAT